MSIISYLIEIRSISFVINEPGGPESGLKCLQISLCLPTRMSEEPDKGIFHVVGQLIQKLRIRIKLGLERSQSGLDLIRALLNYPDGILSPKALTGFGSSFELGNDVCIR